MADETHPTVRPDADLVVLARAGERAALTELLGRHEAWVFNLSFYVLQSRADAEDATQEILLKIATGLAAFRGASSFRTWAHRIALNHLRDQKRSKPETAVGSFECFARYLDRSPDEELPSDSRSPGEMTLLIEEARTACMMGMLLCLDRDQRIVFLLGELLETADVVAAKLLQISPDGYRQRLARARSQLASFMQEKCGLVDPANSCRCSRKTKAFIRDGIVDPDNHQFTRGWVQRSRSIAAQRGRELTQLQSRTFAEIRAFYPRYEAPNLAEQLGELLGRSELRRLLDLNQPE